MSYLFLLIISIDYCNTLNVETADTPGGKITQNNVTSDSISFKNEDNCTKINETNLIAFNKYVLPPLNASLKKGDAGRIGIIGGSHESAGPVYFAAISALKAGADLVYVITTGHAASIIQSFSPDLIVYPYLHEKFLSRVVTLLLKTDVVVIGPGIGRDKKTVPTIFHIFDICKGLGKPLIVDADGIFAIFKNKSIIQDYSSPGAIITPNYMEITRLKQVLSNDHSTVTWGNYTSILEKGETDKYYSGYPPMNWNLREDGSLRRVAGQGSILVGILGTFYNWALKANFCDRHIQYAQSLATYAAAKLTRKCNSITFLKYGRSMTASDMINEIHNAFTSITTV